MYKALILADSIAPHGARLTTMQITFPRFILAEFNTHRQLSRNSASSRAVPVAKRIAEVRKNPFVPEVFTENKRGMQGGNVLEGAQAQLAAQVWHDSAQAAAARAEILELAGVHKQYANRLLEPYLWHTAVVSSTKWSNFFAQRCHPDAQPEIRTIAEMMRDVLEDSTPNVVADGLWHLPYIDNEDREWAAYKDPNRVPGMSTQETLARISTARCARVSYLTNPSDDSEPICDVNADLALFERLKTSGHWSPFEHVATPAGSAIERSGNFIGWYQFRKRFKGECR